MVKVMIMGGDIDREQVKEALAELDAQIVEASAVEDFGPVFPIRATRTISSSFGPREKKARRRGQRNHREHQYCRR